MRNQLNSNAAQLENLSPAYHQKSSLMEEFEGKFDTVFKIGS